MNKRLLSAATAIALCILAAPANARSHDDDDWQPRRSQRQQYEYRWDRSYERYDDDERDAYAERRRRHRAARHNTRTHAQRKSSDRQATTTGRPATTTTTQVQAPNKPQQLAAASPQDMAKPELQPLLPSEAAKPAPQRLTKNDGRGCLKSTARALLDRIEAQFGPMQLISTCRPGARIAGSGRISKHASGEAIDFNAGRRKAEVVRWLIANHKSGGTMTYAGMSHIHVDVGQHFVSLNSGG
jgi:uncharacterized protein YcbK (DUF882 family)